MCLSQAGSYQYQIQSGKIRAQDYLAAWIDHLAMSALGHAIKAWRQAGLSVALVPTMGNLHRGHFSLVEKAMSYLIIINLSLMPKLKK